VNTHKIRALRNELDRVVAGYPDVKEMILVCLLADGHVLLEAVPGTAKTTLANTLQAAIENAVSARIQMTPDLKPTDIVGVEIFDQKTGEFLKRPGPMVGTHILLADEINRTTPKTLSATLQAMQERKVTIGDRTYTLEDLFIMIATMNPVEQEGTYPVPEATLDRFAMKLNMQYVSREDELKMLANTAVHGRSAQSGVKQVVSVEELLEMRAVVKEIAAKATNPVLGYIVDLCRATRPTDGAFDRVHKEGAEALREQIAFGASPRCEIWTLHGAAALAFIENARFIEPRHVQAVFTHVARHRIILTDAAIYNGATTDDVIEHVLERVKVISRPER
jgi:MoxR-like ATPase